MATIDKTVLEGIRENNIARRVSRPDALVDVEDKRYGIRDRIADDAVRILDYLHKEDVSYGINPEAGSRIYSTQEKRAPSNIYGLPGYGFE